MTSTWKDAELHESLGNANETTLKYHCTFIKKAKKKKKWQTQCWKRCRETSLLTHCWWECKTEQRFCKRVWHFLNKTKHTTTVWPALALWDREETGYVYTEVGTQCSEQLLFLIALNQKQLRCPSAGEWISKLCSGHTMKYYSVIKRTELVIHVNSLDAFLENYAERKKVNPQTHSLDEYIYRTFLKWQNYRDGEQMNKCQGLRGSG